MLHSLLATVQFWCHVVITDLKVLSLQNQLKLYLLFCLLDDGLDMPSSIYDAIRVITRVSVWFFWLRISTHYPGADLLTKWLFVYVFIHKQST